MTDRSEIEADLAQNRRDLAKAVAALRAKLKPGNLAGGLSANLFGRANAADAAETTVKAGTAGLQLSQFGPALRTAGTAIRANPVASALAGAGIAWLAWGGMRRAAATKREARPQWLVDAAALRDEAERLRARVAAAQADGTLSGRDATESLAEISTSLAAETRRLMGQGLDGLEDDARAAALASREAVLKREFGTGGGFVRTLTAGTALAGIGGVAAMLLARNSPARSAASEEEAAAGAAINAARRILDEEAARLTAIAAQLSQSLRVILETAAEGDAETDDDADPETRGS